MDPERERIQDDLRGLMHRPVRCNPVVTQLYASDASIFEIEPLAVVCPKQTSDVVATVHYAHSNGLSIHARGAGSGTAGGCLGKGIVLDFSDSMRAIVRQDATSVTVQPGIVLDRLNEQLKSEGRMFAPDPSTAAVTTIGGVLAANRGGSRWLRHGSARDHVLGLQLVLANGEVIEVTRDTKIPATQEQVVTVRDQLLYQIGSVLRRNQQAVDEHAEKREGLLVDGSGYHVRDVLLDDGKLDIPRMIVGSEGTLAVITEATLATVACPARIGVGMLFFDRVDKAARAVVELNREDITACDLLDRRLLSLTREADVRYDVLLPSDAEAVLLIEVEGDDPLALRQRLKAIGHMICRRKRLGIDMRIALDPMDVALFRQLHQRVLPSLSRMTTSQRPVPFIEDIAIPPEFLADFLTSAQNVLKRHEVTATLFAHAGHGQVQLRPFLDLANPDDVTRMQRLASDMYTEVLAVNGTISSHQGDGLSRSSFVRRQFPELYPVFREIKRLFDPTNTLNPGKVTEAEPLQLTKSLRAVSLPIEGAGHASDGTPVMAADNIQTIEILLNWNAEDVAMAARACNGCGMCRTHDPSIRMCPIFRFAPSEEASPRAKANLMRGLFSGQLVPEQLANDDLKSIADLCVNCHQCRHECPAEVDIPKLMIEYKAQYVATNGLAFHDWLMCRPELVAGWASRFAIVWNSAIRSRRARWLIERLTGLAQGRKLPRVARRSFQHSARRQRLDKPVRSAELKVLYFTDIYANWFDVKLAEAVVNVFQHNGVSVYVPQDQLQSGMALVAAGAIDKARSVAAHNLLLLVDAIRQGYTVITAEPSAALCLTRDYPNMISDQDVQLIVDNTHEACTYLWKLHQKGQLELDLKPLHMTVGYHTPCHTRALEVGSPAENLMRLIPGLNVRSLEKGCSGMAGVYGLKRENYRNSLRAGWPLISAIRQSDLQIGATECSSCKMQMEQGTDKPTVHPIKLLALSYGLMPEVAQSLNEIRNNRYVT